LKIVAVVARTTLVPLIEVSTIVAGHWRV